MFATVHITDDDISFCDGSGMLIRTPQSHALTARELPS